jgi:hypothetical protein
VWRYRCDDCLRHTGQRGAKVAGPEFFLETFNLCRRRRNGFRIFSGAAKLFNVRAESADITSCARDDVNPGYPLARASPASRTSILRSAMALVTRSGKSSRSVVLPACMSMPSGSQPVQRQSADSAPSSLLA